MMGNTTGHYNEGYAHPDSKHKIITVLLGFTREWPYERGRLRVLRSNDRNDYAFEFAPEFGRMLMFRVCDHSWHGFLPQKGQRMSLQLCYVDSEWYVRKEYWRHSVSAYAKSVPLLRKIIDWAPRRLLGAQDDGSIPPVSHGRADRRSFHRRAVRESRPRRPAVPPLEAATTCSRMRCAPAS